MLSLTNYCIIFFFNIFIVQVQLSPFSFSRWTTVNLLLPHPGYYINFSIYVYGEREIYYKELAHSSHDYGAWHVPKSAGWAASWRSRRTDVVLVWRPASSSLGILPYWAEGEFLTFSFYARLPLIGCGPPTLGRGIWFIQSTSSNANLIQKHHHRNTQNNVWSNIWAPPCPVKLTHKINPHTH